MWLEAKKRVEYPLVPEIMIDDWVNKGHTNLNMFSVVGEQIKSLSSKQSKLNFWNQTIKTKPYNFDIKCQSNSESYDRHGFLGTKFRRGQNFVLTVGGFFNERDYSGADWLVPLLYILWDFYKGKQYYVVIQMLLLL